MVVTVPNLITVLRILLVPLTVWLIISEDFGLACLTFVVAGLSDFVDGYIARRFKLHTEIGAYLDPVADKALLVSIYVSLGFLKVLPAWLVILVVSRDILIVGAVMLSRVADRPLVIAPHMLSKINTAVQIGFVAMVLGLLALDARIEPVRSLGMAAVALLTAASGALYLRQWLGHMAKS